MHAPNLSGLVERVPGPAEDFSAVVARALRSFPAFCALLQVVDIESGFRKPMSLTGIQRAYCEMRTRRDIVLKARKVFMTTLEVARDLWWFVSKRGARVVIVVQSEQGHAARRTIQAMVRVALESLREHVPVGSTRRSDGKFDVETDTELAWHERDATLRIMEAGAAERTARKGGRSQLVNRLHATEVAFWEHGAETLNSLLNAMPPHSGEAVIESTPNGASGYYFDRWCAAVEGTGAFAPQFFPWYHHDGYREELAPGEIIAPQDALEQRLVEVEHVSPEALKWYRKKVGDIGPDKAAQEFPSDPNTCFLLSGREFFDSKTTTRLLAGAKAPVQVVPLRDSGVRGEMRVYGRPERDRRYVVSADTSEGTGGDDSAATVREVGTGVHVATVQGQIKPHEFGIVLTRVARTYNGAHVAVERNNHGHTTLACLEHSTRYKNVFRDRDDKPGWLSHQVTRAPALAGLEQGHREGTWRTQDRATLGQMRTFVWRERGEGRVKAEAAKGQKDDLVMAEAIGWDVLRRPVRLVTRDDDALDDL